jgi:hypothetical protein
MKPTPRTNAVLASCEQNPAELGFASFAKMHQHAVELEIELDDLREAVRLTLMENLHLADGDT